MLLFALGSSATLEQEGVTREGKRQNPEGAEEGSEGGKEKNTTGHDAITSSPSSPPSSRLPLVSGVAGLGWEDEESEGGMYRQMKGEENKKKGRRRWKMK